MKNANAESEYILSDGTVIKLAADARGSKRGTNKQEQTFDHRKERMHAYAEHLAAGEE